MQDLTLALILWLPTIALTTWFYKDNMGSVTIRELFWIALISLIPFINMLCIIVFGGYLIIRLWSKALNAVCRKYKIDLDKEIL